MRRVLPLLLCAFGFVGCNDSSTPPQPVASAPAKTPAETAQKPEAFEASEFCQQFHCKLIGSWNIEGGTNYSYDVSLPEVIADVQTTWNSPFASGGLTFVDQVLSERQWKAVGLFLESADPSVDHKAGLVFIKVNIKRKVCDNCSVPTSGAKKRDGKLEVTTGQSGADAIVSVVPTNMLQ